MRPESSFGYGRASYELNLGCNYDCEHCYLGLKKFEGLSWPDRERLLHIMRDAGVLWLQLTGGEPMIDRLFTQVYTLAYDLGMMLTLLSNGSRLSNPKLLDLFTSRRPHRITLSVYGASAESYDGLTRRKGAFRMFEKGLLAGHEAGLPLALSMIVTKQMAHYRRDYPRAGPHRNTNTVYRGRGLLKIHCYGDGGPMLGEVTEWLYSWCAAFRVAGARIIWFQSSPDGARTRLMLKAFVNQDKRHYGRVVDLEDCDVADTFPAFAEQLGTDGFGFLYQRIKTGLSNGPILVTVEDRHIVGAIGPLGILLDATGTRTQPPQYFAVHPDYRHRGHGRALWRAAMAWGAENGAEYKVLQAASGSAAELLYLSEGMSTLGFVCSRDVQVIGRRMI